jgi:hypothetical protein
MTDVETFVIRVWTPAGHLAEAESDRLRGIAEHIGSGEHDAFRDTDELLAFLAKRLHTGVSTQPGDRT